VKAEDEEPLWPSGQVRAGRALANETRSGLVAGRNRRLDDATPRRSGSRALSKFGHSLECARRAGQDHAAVLTICRAW
jgi:hypothetical protein